MHKMRVKEYEQGLTQPLEQATLTLLLRDGEVLLAMKKRGLGVGKWNGVGGKPKPGENITDTANRETREEIKVTPLELKKVAILNFYFPLVPAENSWGQRVWVFTTTKWEGEPEETDEMKPKWFKQNNIPYKEMWEDEKIWMPEVFAGSLLKASFMFDKNEKLVDYYIDKVKTFE